MASRWCSCFRRVARSSSAKKGFAHKLHRRHYCEATPTQPPDKHRMEVIPDKQEAPVWHNVAKRMAIDDKQLARDAAKLSELKAMEREVTDPVLLNEIAAYYDGRRKLAEMMGCNPDTFTEQDIEDAINYLLPSNLTARDARPFLKHPLEYYPKRARRVVDADGRPIETSFFTGHASYYNLIYDILQATHQLNSEVHSGEKRNEELDDHNMTLFQKQLARSRWLTHNEVQDVLKEDISEELYQRLVERLETLAKHPLAHEIADLLSTYQKIVVTVTQVKNMSKLDGAGVAKATGKRKTAVASVRVWQGRGEVTVNHCGLVSYFPLMQSRQQVLYPLMLVGALGKFDVQAKVYGGGSTGQAGTIRHGISKALVAFGQEYHTRLEEAGLLLRDPRMVKHKKLGQKKARKKFAWVKR